MAYTVFLRRGVSKDIGEYTGSHDGEMVILKDTREIIVWDDEKKVQLRISIPTEVQEVFERVYSKWLRKPLFEEL